MAQGSGDSAATGCYSLRKQPLCGSVRHSYFTIGYFILIYFANHAVSLSPAHHACHAPARAPCWRTRFRSARSGQDAPPRAATPVSTKFFMGGGASRPRATAAAAAAFSAGGIKTEQLQALCRKFGLELSHKRAAGLFAAMDEDGNGTLEEHEFVGALSALRIMIGQMVEAATEDPLAVGTLLEEGRKGEVPLALAAECALASTKAVYANLETKDLLVQMVDGAQKAHAATNFSRHKQNAKKWAKQLEGVGAEADRLHKEAPAANEAAMDKLMPLVAQAQHKYDAAFDAVQAKERAHLAAIHRRCGRINEENKDKPPPRQTPTPVAVEAVPIEGADDPRHPGYLLRLYEDAAKAKPAEAAQAALGALVPAVALVKAAPLKGTERAVAKTLEENEGDFSRLQDLARLSIECKTAEGAAQAIKALMGSSQLRLTRAKDRLSGLDEGFDPAAIGGYRDVMLNALLNGHLVEIQIHLEDFLQVKKSAVGHAVYKYARALHGFDQERIKYNGPITKEVVERASKGLVRYIDAQSTPKPAPEVCKLVVPKLLSAGSLLLELNLSKVELDDSWAELFGEAPLCCEVLRELRLYECKLRGPLPTLQLPSLQMLRLGGQQLTGGLEPLKGCTALQELTLHNNQLTGGLEPLKGCTALQELKLHKNQLTGGLEPLMGCTALKKLTLEKNQLNITAEDKAHFEKQVKTFSCD